MKFQDVANIVEEIKPVNGGKGIIVLDIDDTLLSADPKVIKVYKSVNGGPEIGLNTAEFAQDKDKGKPGVTYDYREFNDPIKVYQSIINGTPKIKNLKMLDAHLRAGYDMSFLTARGLQKVVTDALGKFLLFKNKDGNLVKIPQRLFKKDLSAAINDEDIKYPGANDAEKKANVLRKLCKKYKYVKFVDDDPRNVKAAKELAKSECPNLMVVKAWEN